MYYVVFGLFYLLSLLPMRVLYLFSDIAYVLVYHLVGYLVTKGASFRKESRGLHYTTDYPENSELVQNIVL